MQDRFTMGETPSEENASEPGEKELFLALKDTRSTTRLKVKQRDRDYRATSGEGEDQERQQANQRRDRRNLESPQLLQRDQGKEARSTSLYQSCSSDRIEAMKPDCPVARVARHIFRVLS